MRVETRTMKIHMVLIVRYSGELICKVEPRNFRIVFNELRGLGGFRALDNLGLGAGSIPGVSPWPHSEV